MNLVAPIVPNAQENKAPELMLRGMAQGLASAAQFADMRRRSEMDIMQLAARERMAEDQLALEKEKMSQDYELRDRQISVTKSYYDGITRNRNTAIDFNLQRQALIAEVNDSAEKLKLNDPEFQTKNPIRFAQGVRDFEDMWRLSPLPEVKHAISQYKSVAEEQKIPIKVGMVEKDGAWTGGETKNVPILQIVKNLKDPATREKTQQILAANGLMKVPKELEDQSGKWFGRGLDKSKLKPTEIADPRLSQAMEQSANLDTSKKASRVPTAMLPKSAGKGTEPTDIEPELPVEEPQASNSQEPVFEPTQGDQMLFNAKAAIAKGAPIAAVAQRFQEMGGDPSQLWQS